MNLNVDRKRHDYAAYANKIVANKNLELYYNSQMASRADMGSRNRNPSNQLFSNVQNLPKKLNISPSVTATISPIGNVPVSNASPSDFRTVRSDASLVPPIRQTASIFKQPVTLVKNQEGKVKTDNPKHGPQEKPKQLLWEKRLENFQACDSEGSEFSLVDLPRYLKPVGPEIQDKTLFQSVATALHSSLHPVTGQTAAKTVLSTHPGVYVNPEQPLFLACTITEDDIKKQEDRVLLARKKLQEALAV